MTDSISLVENEPRILTFVTYPRGQVIFSILALFAIILFNSFFYFFRPYDGMGVTQEGPLGEVYSVDPGGPAEKGGVRIGDQILAIDGRPIRPLLSEPRYQPGIRWGDVVRFNLERNGQVMQVSITMGSYFDNTSLLALYLGIQLLSLGLWAIGLVLMLITSGDDLRARLVSLGFLMAGLTAAAGGASGWNSLWGAPTLEKVLLSLIVPVIISAHLTFPSISFPKIRTSVIYLSLAIGSLLAALVIIDDWILTPEGHSFSVYPGIHLRQVILVFFMVSWLAAIALLINNRLRAHDSDIRRQTGIIMWGMALGVGPFFVLTLLPYLLFGQEYLTGSVTILFLLLLPLAYTYVIFQRNLLKVDFLINRIVVWFILVLLILIASILVFGIFVLIFKLPPGLPLYGCVVAALIALPFASLSKTVQREVDKVLYGNHYESSTVTASLSSRLAQALVRRRLFELLTRDLPQQMGIQEAALLLVEGDRLKQEGNQEKPMAISLEDPFCRELLDNHAPLRSIQFNKMFVSPRQSDWKQYIWGQVFAPLLFENNLQGVLILGERTSGDIYSDQDLSIIATVAQQGALAAVNILLVERFRKLTQQLVRSDETQHKHLANDLHDSLLQDLFYIKQLLHKDPHNAELAEALEESIRKLRRMIMDQRSPLLNQGLTLALQGLVEDMQKLADPGVVITLEIAGSMKLALSDEQATCIYRIAQEALNNALKHARASKIQVKLEDDAGRALKLVVSDDGIGIGRVSQGGSSEQGHFGLILMRERAMMIDAHLKIRSRSAEGTRVVLDVQL